jgi:CYTH domain-containing protein
MAPRMRAAALEERRSSVMEIERKWMVAGWPEEKDTGRPEHTYQMRQGYISVRPTVRIRREAEEAGETHDILCFKGKGRLAREEIETEIDADLFERLAAFIGAPLITKERRDYRLPDGHMLEVSCVDAGSPSEFYYAEVEYESEEEARRWEPQTAGLEAYLTDEVTDQPGQSMGAYWEQTRQTE